MFDNMRIANCNGHEIEYPCTYASLAACGRYLVANINKCQEHNLDEALAAYASQYLPLFRAKHKSRSDLNSTTYKTLESITCA